MRIGLFDSGIGGLNVLNSLRKKYPKCDYIYFGDTLNVPYGNKSKEELYNLSSKIVEFLISKEVDIIIIACGTISSNCYNELKKNYNIKIYDIISPTIDYINNKKYDMVGVIGTSMTIRSGIFESNINSEVIGIECPKFVPLIESKENDDKKIYDIINEYLNIFMNHKIDTLVLGCTHYPYLINYFKRYFDYEIDYIDMGEVITNQLDIENEGSGKIEYYFSEVNENIKKSIKDDCYEIEL